MSVFVARLISKGICVQCPFLFRIKYVIRFAPCLAFSVSQACSKDEGNCLRVRLEVYFVLLEYIFFDIRNMGSQNANILKPSKF